MLKKLLLLKGILGKNINIMIKLIKIFDIKGLKECELTELGKVNVICGKNNSGKTTILEGISNKENSSLGIKRDILLNYFDIKMKEGYSKVSYPQIINLFEEVINSREFWFKDDFYKFNNDLSIKHSFSQFKTENLPASNSIEADYLFNFNDDYDPVLIPPKRSLETEIQIDANKTIEPNGSGILNYLFYAKNQTEISKDNKSLIQLFDAFKRISSGYEFDMFSDKGNNIKLCFREEEKQWIDAKDSGLGLHDLLVILYYSICSTNDVILIEEPENHIHPDMQRKLLFFLNEIENKQFIISTHSNIFLNDNLVDKIMFAQFQDEIKVEDVTNKARVLNNLGYTVYDNLVSDLIILIEGPKDKPFIIEFLIKLGLYEKYEIKIWAMGGDIMDQHDLTVFKQNHHVIALIDNDPKSRKIRSRFLKNCRDLSIDVTKLKRYSLENYVTVDALKKVFPNEMQGFNSDIDPKKKLENQIGFSIKKNLGIIAKEMENKDIEGTDLYDFFIKIPSSLDEK